MSIMSNAEIRVEMEKIKEDILSKVTCQIFNKSTCGNLLESLAYEDVLDLAIIFITDEKYHETPGCYALRKNELKMLDISKTELLEAAKNNMRKKGIEFMSMRDRLIASGVPAEMLQIDESVPIIYTLATSEQEGGAAIIACEDVLEMVSNKLQGDVYLLPSSVHEFLCLSAGQIDQEGRLDDLKEMVVSTNADPKVIRSTDFLSDSVYRYCADTKKLKIAA